MRLYADADFAGDSEDGESIFGNILVLVSPNTYLPLSWSSVKQMATSRSTMESEVVSLANGMVSEAMSVMILWDLLLERIILLYSMAWLD